jgi:serine/threonine-protein kinase RsbW
MFADLTGFLDEAAVATEFRHSIMLSISEAFSNALVHGNQCRPEKQVTIRLQSDGNELSAEIEDEGTGGLERLRSRKAPHLLAESGRGIDFIQRYASGVDFDQTKQGGLKVMIRFSIQSKNTVNS